MYIADQLEPDFESASPIMQPFLHNQNKPAHFHVQTPTSNNNSLLIEDNQLKTKTKGERTHEHQVHVVLIVH